MNEGRPGGRSESPSERRSRGLSPIPALLWLVTGTKPISSSEIQSQDTMATDQALPNEHDFLSGRERGNCLGQALSENFIKTISLDLTWHAT